jgi:hypothetical protein
MCHKYYIYLSLSSTFVFFLRLFRVEHLAWALNPNILDTGLAVASIPTRSKVPMGFDLAAKGTRNETSHRRYNMFSR